MKMRVGILTSGGIYRFQPALYGIVGRFRPIQQEDVFRCCAFYVGTSVRHLQVLAGEIESVAGGAAGDAAGLAAAAD